MGLIRRFVALSFLFSSTIGLSAMQSVAAPEGDETAAGRGAVRRAGTLPRTVRFSGALASTDETPRRGVVTLTFTMYSEPQGGSPIWVETQNVNVDENGRYTSMLGAASGNGLPVSLFASGEARWLGVRVAEEGAAEQPRVQLVSVPYALAAADAQTLGGRPVSDFQLSTAAKGTEQAPGPTPTATVVNGSAPGVLNYMTKWEDATTVIPSYLLYENGSNIGIGTITPTALLHVNATAGDAFNLYTSTTAGGSVAVYANHFGAASIGYAGFFTKTGAGTTNIGLYAEASGATNNYAALFQGGNVGIGTSSPVAKLQVNATNQDAINIYSTATGGGSVALFASHSGAAPLGYAGYFSKTGGGATNIGLVGSASGAANNYAALFPDGNVGIGTSAPTQKLHVAGTIYSSTGGFRFPDNTVQTTAATGGGGGGDITGVTAGNGLAGGGLAGDVTLNIKTCTEGQILKYMGATWTCSDDNGGGSPGTQTFTIPGPAFNNLGAKVVAVRMTLDNNASTTNRGWFILPFDGGTITALRVCGRDNDAEGQIIARLYRRSKTLSVFSDAELMASIGSGAAFGNDTTQCFSTTTITNGALDSVNYAYTVELEMSAFVQVNAVQVDNLDN